MLLVLVVSAACGTATDASLTVYGASSSDAGSALVKSGSVVRALGSPSSLNINVFAFYVSANADCSSPILVDDYGDTPETFDLVDNPVLFTGTPADGTYECVIIVVEDTPTFTADAAAVAANPVCGNTSAVHTLDLYRDGETESVDMDGNPIIGTGTHGSPSTDTILFVASTDSAAAIAAGYHENQIGELDNPLVIPGTTTFVFDFTDQIATSSEDSVDYCWVEGPEVRFE